MSTSLQSDRAVALLWNDRWWIEGRTEPVVFGEFSHAAAALLGEFGDVRPARLRLVYQPSFLTAQCVECPNGNRALLQQVLRADFPGLENPGHAWSYEPILPGPARFGTVLYHETQPGLFALAEDLAHGGIEVEGAWPLGAVLNLLPDEWPDTGALSVIAVAENRTVIFRHTPDGVRDVQIADGNTAATVAQSAIQAALFRTDVALHVAALDDAGQQVAARFAPGDVARMRLVPWSKLALAVRNLPLRHSSQLLPLATWRQPRRLVTWATAAASLATVLLVTDFARSCWHDRVASAKRQEAVRGLQQEIASLQEEAAEIPALRRELTGQEKPRAACALLLQSLQRELPPQIVLTRVRVDRDGFTVSGGVAATGLTEAAWRAWRAAWSTNAHWQLADASMPMPTADFSAKGRWQ